LIGIEAEKSPDDINSSVGVGHLLSAAGATPTKLHDFVSNRKGKVKEIRARNE
jgi:hypothetical protein